MLAVAVLAALLVLAVAFKYLMDLRRLKNFPPGPPRLPMLGALPFMPSELTHLHAEKHWLPKYGPVVGMSLGRGEMVIVCGAKEVFEVLAHEDCQSRPDMFMATERAFGRKLGIMFSDGPYWTEQRRFALRELRDLGMGKSKMEGVVLGEVEATLEAMVREGPAIQPNHLFQAPVLNVLWWMVSGKPFALGVGAQQDPMSRRLQEIMTRFMRTRHFATAPVDNWPVLKYIAPELSSYNAIYGPIFDMHAFVREEVKLQRQQRSDSFIGNYVEQIERANPGSGLDEESLITSVLDLFLAGGESIANTLSFCLLYITLNPTVQAKVQAELDSVFGDPSQAITLSDKAKLPYVEATMAEVMRINTIAPMTPPHRNTKDITLNGYTIPQGTIIQLSLWSVLHDKEHWGDPETFRPERFIANDGSFMKDPWLSNFGHGKRFCIAESFTLQTTFLFFANLMNRFRFRVVPGSPPLSTKAVTGFTVAPQEYTILVEPRGATKS